ncbi:MAG TPA: hypothetical protein V6C97_27920 [Oculatellaceae cyanobacterium]
MEPAADVVVEADAVEVSVTGAVDVVRAALVEVVAVRTFADLASDNVLVLAIGWSTADRNDGFLTTESQNSIFDSSQAFLNPTSPNQRVRAMQIVQPYQ